MLRSLLVMYNSFQSQQNRLADPILGEIHDLMVDFGMPIYYVRKSYSNEFQEMEYYIYPSSINESIVAQFLPRLALLRSPGSYFVYITNAVSSRSFYENYTNLLKCPQYYSGSKPS